MITIVDGPRRTEQRVRVCLGQHTIADYAAEPAKAIRYQAGMTHLFASLRITIEPITTAVEDVDDA